MNSSASRVSASDDTSNTTVTYNGLPDSGSCVGGIFSGSGLQYRREWKPSDNNWTFGVLLDPVPYPVQLAGRPRMNPFGVLTARELDNIPKTLNSTSTTRKWSVWACDGGILSGSGCVKVVCCQQGRLLRMVISRL